MPNVHWLSNQHAALAEPISLFTKGTSLAMFPMLFSLNKSYSLMRSLYLNWMRSVSDMLLLVHPQY